MTGWKMTDEWQMVVDGFLVERGYHPDWMKSSVLKQDLIEFLGRLHAAGLLNEGEDTVTTQYHDSIVVQWQAEMVKYKARLAELKGERNTIQIMLDGTRLEIDKDFHRIANLQDDNTTLQSKVTELEGEVRDYCDRIVAEGVAYHGAGVSVAAHILAALDTEAK